jgi:hypothetical protein
MNRTQLVTLLITVANLALVLLFPPFDYVSVARTSVPTFEGFSFYFAHGPNRILNSGFLTLEAFVVLINGLIVWLLTRTPAPTARTRFDYQRVVLIMVAINLVIMLLFPPFQSFNHVTKAALPSFDGFYLVFGDNTKRVIVTPILWLEVSFLLINGGLFWLLLKDRGRGKLSAAQIRRLSGELKKQR